MSAQVGFSSLDSVWFIVEYVEYVFLFFFKLTMLPTYNWGGLTLYG